MHPQFIESFTHVSGRSARVADLGVSVAAVLCGYPVLDADAARLSAFIRTHLGLDGHYSFVLPDLGGRPRPLRDPEAASD